MIQRTIELDGLHFRSDDNDGRTLEGRFLPFSQRARVADPGVPPYDEEFAPGCLTGLCQNVTRAGHARWIRLDLDHREDLDNRIGFAEWIEQRDDGAYGTFRLHKGPQLDKVRSMLEESHTGLSVNFQSIRARNVEGVVQRLAIDIAAVAATPVPAYAGAKILAMRSGEEVPPATPNFDEVREWLRSINPTGTSDFDDVDPTLFHPGDCCG